jgi:hypothetical protein
MITPTQGDPLSTTQQTLAFGHNALGRAEVTPFEARLYDLYPPAFATYRKLCRDGRLKPGMIWLWRESQPLLLFMVVRESPVGITRLRYVEGALLTLAREYPLYGIESLALVPLAPAIDWSGLEPVVSYWLQGLPLSVHLYHEGV